MFQYINIKFFMLSFILGLAFVQLVEPDVEKVIVYPTPDNANLKEYVDKAGNCFKFTSEKVTCPSYGAKNIPIQT